MHECRVSAKHMYIGVSQAHVYRCQPSTCRCQPRHMYVGGQPKRNDCQYFFYDFKVRMGWGEGGGGGVSGSFHVK